MKQVLLIWLLLFVVDTVQAAKINVPADQPTIQAAINAANNGDTVLVAPGTYFENINFLGKAITVESSGGRKVTIIDGQSFASVVTFNSGEGRKSVLRGFTIQHGVASGVGEGGGIYIYYASPTVTGNTVINNTAANGGGGIAVSFSSALVQGNTVSGNSQNSLYTGGVGGGGIMIGGAGSAQILSNLVQNNTWRSASGGGIAVDAAGTATLKNNIVRENAAASGTESQGGGIYIINASDVLLVQNLIYNNTAGQGSGIYFGVPYGYTGPLLLNNTIVGTSSAAQGSAVYADGFYDQVNLYNNLMIGASGTSAIYCDNTYDNTSPTLSNNDAYSPSGSGIAGACSAQSGANGNISADPLFVGKSNFHLQAGSPAIDAGDNSAPDLPAKDIAGGPRIVNGVIDIGAYEYPQ